MNIYTAVCHREDPWWVITLPELDSGRVTQCRDHAAIEATARDLVSLVTGADPASIGIRLAAEPVPLEELAELNPDLDQRGLRRLQAFEQLLAEDDQACGYQDPEGVSMDTISNHEYVALELLDFGFELPQFADLWPALIEKGWVVQREDRLRVTGDGRRMRFAYKDWQREGRK